MGEASASKTSGLSTVRWSQRFPRGRGQNVEADDVGGVRI